MYAWAWDESGLFLKPRLLGVEGCWVLALFVFELGAGLDLVDNVVVFEWVLIIII